MNDVRSFWWNEDEIEAALTKEVEEMSREELERVAKELERRFTQLWDTVTYERDSWEGAVDRHGGSFTQDELNDTGWH